MYLAFWQHDLLLHSWNVWSWRTLQLLQSCRAICSRCGIEWTWLRTIGVGFLLKILAYPNELYIRYILAHDNNFHLKISLCVIGLQRLFTTMVRYYGYCITLLEFFSENVHCGEIIEGSAGTCETCRYIGLIYAIIPHIQTSPNFLCMLPMAVAWSSWLQWNMFCTLDLVDDHIFP